MGAISTVVIYVICSAEELRDTTCEIQILKYQVLKQLTSENILTIWLITIQESKRSTVPYRP